MYLAPLLCQPARLQGRFTLLLRFTWITDKVFFSFFVTREHPPTHTHISPFSKTFQQEPVTQKARPQIQHLPRWLFPFHNKYFVLLLHRAQKGLQGAPATSPSCWLLSPAPGLQTSQRGRAVSRMADQVMDTSFKDRCL